MTVRTLLGSSTSLLRLALTAAATLGIVLAGSTQAAAHLGEVGASRGCPEEMALVGSSCVDRWEASLVEIQADGTETAYSPYEAPNGHRVRAVSRPGIVPQAHMSMVEAKRACSASGKRLCRAAEWKTACKGPDQTKFPYGNDRVAGACVDTGRVSPVRKLFNGEHSSRTMNNPLLNQQDGTLEATGEAKSCTNNYGVFDMVGNLHEWTDDASFRGGYYLDTHQNGDGCEYRTTAHAPAYYDYSIGFRCCADPGEAPESDEDARLLEGREARLRRSEPTSVPTEPRTEPGTESVQHATSVAVPGNAG